MPEIKNIDKSENQLDFKKDAVTVAQLIQASYDLDFIQISAVRGDEAVIAYNGSHSPEKIISMATNAFAGILKAVNNETGITREEAELVVKVSLDVIFKAK